ASILQCTSILHWTKVLLMSSHNESCIIQDKGVKTAVRLKTYLLNYFVFYNYCLNEIFGNVQQ
uniref:Uncharacterized protein n=1 Tax=Amphimedon queenslandica TaxID=400682 RepID=A0A1X7SVS2_AMPQE